MTPETSSAIIVALLLYLASKPMAIGSSRLTEAVLRLFGTSPDPRRRNMIRTAVMGTDYQDVVIDSIVREALLPGLLLFFFSGIDNAGGSGEHQGNTMALATALILTLLAALFRITGSLKKSATATPIPIGHAISTASAVIAALLAVTNGVPLEQIASIAILVLFTTQLGTLLLRGARNFGIFTIFWMPGTALAWLCRVYAISICAPVILPLTLVELWLLNSPIENWTGFRKHKPLPSA